MCRLRHRLLQQRSGKPARSEAEAGDGRPAGVLLKQSAGDPSQRGGEMPQPAGDHCPRAAPRASLSPALPDATFLTWCFKSGGFRDEPISPLGPLREFRVSSRERGAAAQPLHRPWLHSRGAATLGRRGAILRLQAGNSPALRRALGGSLCQKEARVVSIRIPDQLSPCLLHI